MIHILEALEDRSADIIGGPKMALEGWERESSGVYCD